MSASRTLRLAYSFGGDTDTIGSMAGAIAGALCGASAIPARLAEQCEDSALVMDQAERLFRVSMAGRQEEGAT